MSGAAERIEQIRQEELRDRPLVMNLDPHVFPRSPVELEGDARVWRAVLPGIGDEVRENLQHAVCVPGPTRIADDVTSDLPRGVRELELIRCLRAQLGEVRLAGLDLDAATRARAGKVEELIDHRRHTLAARQ